MRHARVGLTSSSGDGTTSRIEKIGRGYLDALAVAGAMPVVLPTVDPRHAAAALDGVDALVLTGGGDVDPARYGAAAEAETSDIDDARDEWELALVAEARRVALPILGICRGAQVLNVAFGGTLVQHLPNRVPNDHSDLDRAAEEVHEIDVVAGSRLAEIVGSTLVRANTIHHQSIDVVGDGLVISGRADDGVIEAVESTSSPILGVQWHPELLTDRAPHQALFAWIAAEAAARTEEPQVRA